MMGRGVLVLWLICTACDRGSSSPSKQAVTRGKSELGGQVVSTVEGHAITLADVRALQRGTNLAARDALRKLQSERVLMSEAERRGFASDSEVAGVRRKALVQAFLRAEAAAVEVTDREIEEAYAAAGKRFARGEARASVHLLARAPENASAAVDAAAKAFAQSLIDELASAEDLQAFIAKHQREKHPLFESIAQAIPPIEQDAPFAKPYLDALFQRPGPGTVLQPVRTRFGWHAVRVTEVVAAVSTPLDSVRKTLREELLATKREEHMKALVSQLRRTYGVKLSQGADKALASLSF